MPNPSLDRFNTLRKRWLLTYNISPFGKDKPFLSAAEGSEGAGVENYLFNSLLARKTQRAARSLELPADLPDFRL